MLTKRMMTYLGLGLWLMGVAIPVASAGPLEQSIQHGKQLFTTAHFGGNGRTCNSCHRGEGKAEGQLPNGKSIPSLSNAATIFPRYSRGANKVITLPQQVHRCIMNALQGMPPAYDSAAITDLVSYVTSLSQGKRIDMGGAPQ